MLKRKWLMWVTLILFAPVGIFLLWKNKHYGKNASIALSIVFGLFFIAMASGGDGKNQKTVSVLPKQTTTPIKTLIPTPIKTLTPEEAAKIAEAKAAEDKKKADEVAAKKAELEKQMAAIAEEERIGYDTGITYNQLARTPDDFMSKKVKFTGKVIQVSEGDAEVTLRVAVGGDYDTVLMVGYEKKIISSRILDNDNITIKGLSSGVISYESTMGGKITIPGVLAKEITINNN
jgi:hypothetical protein